ncbi:hypothetical protein ACJMK2_015435 [Sinanodonta woodiana]|uniref:Chitin-binding type-2 domain-containing protein n=1 Tax=Sinanodonta woodiana TaxID=1069815 RepID=A0ABD3UT83_SINWO
MYKLVLLAVCANLAFGAKTADSNQRDKRQAIFGLNNCYEPPVNNPCATNNGQIYYAHPTDTTKFLQCGQGSRMFIIKCPSGEVYNQATTSCTRPQIAVNPQINPANPCTAVNLASGNIFFAYTSDNTKFIECSPDGNAQVLSCPSRLVWNQARQSCVLISTTGTGTLIGGTVIGTGGTITGTGTIIGTGITTNPCTAQAITSQNLFFPHPDATKFIQCDLAGDAYVMQCPSGLVWNQSTSTCASPYAVGNPLVITG